MSQTIPDYQSQGSHTTSVECTILYQILYRENQEVGEAILEWDYTVN